MLGKWSFTLFTYELELPYVMWVLKKFFQNLIENKTIFLMNGELNK